MSKLRWSGCLLSVIAMMQTAYGDELLQMDLEQLMRVQVDGSATLTPTASRRMPASITSIDRRMIDSSGARSLFDLLEMFVPNFHYLPHHWEAPHMGMRGLIGDRDDKYLLVVNGRVLNEKTHFGALSERDMPLLGDIRKIDVVRGPGSVVYGPGAVSMVINIQTDSFSAHGADGVKVQWGEGEQFRAVEFRETHSFSDSGDHGLWLYGGISQYQGAGSSASPLIYGLSDSTVWGDKVTGGEPVPFSVPNNHEAFHDRPKMKLHAHYQKQDFNAWLRYTQGGEQLTWEHKLLYAKPNGSATPGASEESYATGGVGYQQLSLDLSRQWVLDEQRWFELKGGYDTTVYVRELWNLYQIDHEPENHREEEYQLRGTLNWNHNARHATAFGSELTLSRWGLSSPGYDQPYSSVLGAMSEWNTLAIGVFGEHQWQLNGWLTQFAGLRADKDQYTGWMWSPRLAWVASVSEQDTVKAILSRSLRKNNAEELRAQHLAGERGQDEQLDSAELIYDHAFTPALSTTLTGFYNRAELLGINFNTLRTQPVGDFKYGGAEFEVNYRIESLLLGFSHAWSKLDDFNLADGASTRITASHLGYGNDLNNWSNHISKLYSQWQFAPRWQLNSDLRLFWGYPGAHDIIEQTNDAREDNPNSSATNLTDAGNYDSTKLAAFFDLGLSYQSADYGRFGLNGYNLLGLLDEDLNKRLYLLNVGNYRPEAVAFALTWEYGF
ncbi:TonB-dependent receptor plug domain-containing protein [Pseudaeromonas sharmana]|uniref:TonB-dependent receptor plug domain-containing protein n=1 Tax=Pseudaeromonas sharmana TaxID=328412 RepID=A0ABV8CN64_9GAMM